MTMPGELPAALRQAVDKLLEGVSRRDLSSSAQRLSASYRKGGVSSESIVDEAAVLSYLVARLPATFAANVAVMAETARRIPAFQPRSVLDVGAGPGTASWAAATVWPAIGDITMLDHSARLLATAARLAAGSGQGGLRSSRQVLGGVDNLPVLPRSDLVLASYMLVELDDPKRRATLLGLWESTAGVLVLVEPGTPAGHARMLEARSWLLEEGAQLVAPCPHAAACPLVSPDWCHFSQRLPRSRDHRQAKVAALPFEDEKFAYLVVARAGNMIDVPDARVLSPPHMNKAEIKLKLCTDRGLEIRTVPRREKADYAAARRLSWGDAL